MKRRRRRKKKIARLSIQNVALNNSRLKNNEAARLSMTAWNDHLKGRCTERVFKQIIETCETYIAVYGTEAVCNFVAKCIAGNLKVIPWTTIIA